MIYFKIRKKGSDPQLFSTGGALPTWNKNGKAWTNIGHIKSHLHQVTTRRNRWGNRPRANYDEAEVVHFKMVEVGTQPLQEVRDAVKLAREAKQRRLEEGRKRRTESDERVELARLKAKFPGE